MDFKKFIPHLALLTVAFIYGANYVVAKSLMADQMISPNAFILCRSIAGTVLFWVTATLFVREKLKKEDIPMMLALALFGIAINQLCFFAGLKITSAIHGSLIMVLTPILVLIISSFLLKEKITKLKAGGVLLGLIGAGTLILLGSSALGGSSIKGDLLVFVNATSYGLYLVLLKQIIHKYNVITIVKWAYTFGFIFILPFGIGGLREVEWHQFTNEHWMSFAYVLLCTTYLAYLLNAFAMNKVKPTTVSSYVYLQPLIATGIAIALGEDKIDLIKVLAASLIFLGVFSISYKKKAVLKIK